MVLRESGRSRTAWFPGDIERTSWLTGHGDLMRLLHNTIRWLTHDERMVQVDGPGFLEMFAWETTPGYAIHLLNYNTPDAQHGCLQSIEPLGPQQVRMKGRRHAPAPRRKWGPSVHGASHRRMRGRGDNSQFNEVATP